MKLQSLVNEFISSDKELPTYFDPGDFEMVEILYDQLVGEDGARGDRYPKWIWDKMSKDGFIEDDQTDGEFWFMTDLGDDLFTTKEKFQTYLRYYKNQLPSNPPKVQEAESSQDKYKTIITNLTTGKDKGMFVIDEKNKLIFLDPKDEVKLLPFTRILIKNGLVKKYGFQVKPFGAGKITQESFMKLSQLIKEASEKGKAPEKGNKAIDSSGLEKAKETSLNHDGENAGVIKHTDEMSEKVKSKIEALIKKHASNVKWEKDQMYWHFTMKDKIVARTRLTGLDWYEKPQELVDLENELRAQYHGFIGKITWNEEGEVCVPLKNVVLSEGKINEGDFSNNPVKEASFDQKSALERIVQDVWKEPSLGKAKQIFTDFVSSTKINDNSKRVMIDAVSKITSKPKLDFYVSNALLKFEKLGMNQLSKSPMDEEGCEVCGDEMSLSEILKRKTSKK